MSKKMDQLEKERMQIILVNLATRKLSKRKKLY